METHLISNVSNFTYGFWKLRIIIFIFFLICFSPEISFGQKEERNPDKKATVCHKGITIKVSLSAVESHLAHGDYLGPCVVAGQGTIAPLYSPPEGEVKQIGPELTSLLEKYTKLGSVPSDDIYMISGDKVLIEIIADNFSDIEAIKTKLLGYDVEIYDDFSDAVQDLIITVLFPIEKLPELNNDPKIQSARPVHTPILKSGIVTSQGDIAIQSDNARMAFDLTGNFNDPVLGDKICVMSDSYNAKQKAQSDIDNGDLPSDIVISEDFSSDFGSHYYVVDEGRAMLQIMHDVAPGANLGFRTGFKGIEHMANGIQILRGIGCHIIVDDITHLNEPFYKDGLISTAVNEVTSSGTLYFSSAGNFANWGYESQFSPAPGNPTFHSFGSGDIHQIVEFKEAGIYIIVLQWNDIYKSLGTLEGPTNNGAENDLDILLKDDAGNELVGLRTNNIGGDPIEVMPVKVTGPTLANLLIERTAGATPNLEFKYIVFVGGSNFNALNYTNTYGASTIVGQANAEGALTVGAANYTETQAFGINPPEIEYFSSHGQIGGGKPNFVSADGVNTSVTTIGLDADYDTDIFPNFLGTSAAAPHAAAIAALLLESKVKFGVDFDVADKMQETALSMNSNGNISGHGFVLADSAIMSFANPIPAISRVEVPDGIGDGSSNFEIKIVGKNLLRQSEVYVDDSQLPEEQVTYIDPTTIIADIINPITINSTIQIKTPPITPNSTDGGDSEIRPIISIPKIMVTVIADDQTKKFGEINPDFTETVLVDGIPLDDPDLDLIIRNLLTPIGFLFKTTAKIWSETENEYCSPTGTYFISPIGIDPNTVEIMEDLDQFDFKFVEGYLTIEEMPLTIKPVTEPSYIYGLSLEGIYFEYDLYSDDIDDLEDNIANDKIDNLELLKKYIETEHKSTFPENFTNAIVDRARQLVNRGRQLVNESGWLVSDAALGNRARQLVNGDISIDLDIDLLTNYVDPLTGEIVNPDGTIPNRGRQLVNGEFFYNGGAYIKDELGNRARQLVNEGGLGTIESEGEEFSDITLIVDTTDATISNIYSINLISGLDVNPEDGDPEYEGAPQYCVPGAFISPAADNFITTYTSTAFDILPATLGVTAVDTWIINGDPLPEFSSTVEGRAYNETSEIVFSGIDYEPSSYGDIGHYDIIPDPILNVPSNYILDENIVNGTLTVTENSDLKYLVSTSEGVGLVDALGNSTSFISTSSKDLEIYKDIIYVLTSDFKIEKYDRAGQPLGTPIDVSQILNPGQYLGFVILPNFDIALLDNVNDKIYFINPQGDYIISVNMLETPDGLRQNMDGVVVGNHLIVSDDGYNRLIDVNLESYEVTTFRDLSHLDGWLGAIDYYNGTYYICQSTEIWSFDSEVQGESLIATLPVNNITSILVAGHYAYVTINHYSRLYRVDINTGAYEIFVDEGLPIPSDIEPLLPKYVSPQTNGKIAIAPFNSNITTENPRGDTDILVVNSDGTNPITLVEGSDFVRDPVFSPDGTEIVFTLSPTSATTEPNLWKVKTDGSSAPVQLTSQNLGDVAAYSPDGSRDAIFSPDGNKIAFCSQNNGSEILIMNIDGLSNPDPITDNGGSKWSPVFSPDGQEIYYLQSGGSVGTDIWKVNINVPNEEILVTIDPEDVTYYTSIDFLKDGSKIIYSKSPGSGQSGDGIGSIDPDGSNKFELHTGSASDPSVSPDNTKIAFIKSDGDVDLYVMDVNGENVHEIYSRGSNNTLQPSWGTYPDELEMFSSTSSGSSLTQGEITVYPNPLINVLSVLHADENITNIDVFIRSELTGTVLFNANAPKILSEFEVDLSHLASGNYILQINDGKTMEEFHIKKE